MIKTMFFLLDMPKLGRNATDIFYYILFRKILS